MKMRNALSFRKLYILLLSFAFLIHISYINNGFTWLDHGDIEKKRAVVTVNELPHAFFSRYGDTGFYRPVVTTVNSIDAAVYNDYAPGYHITNVLLFVAVISVVPFFLMTYFGISRFESLIAACIVSIHPFGFLPVGSISYRPELLLTLFSLLTILLWIKLRRTNDPWDLVLASFCFFSALLSKETAIVLVPAGIGLWELFQHVSLRSKKHSGARQKITSSGIVWYAAAFFVVTIMYLALRLSAVPEIWRVSTEFSSPSEMIGTRLLIVGKLLIHFLSPFHVSISDVTLVVPVTNPLALLTLCWLLFIIVLAFRIGINKPFGKALVLFILFILPAFNIIPTPRMSSPHYGFIALIPFSVLVAIVIKSFTSYKTRNSFLLRLIFFMWITIASFTTLTNGTRFRNDETLFKPEVKHNTYYPEGYFYLGNFYFDQKQFTKAESAYRLALQSSPSLIAYREESSLLINLSAVYYVSRQLSKADDILQQAQRVAADNEQEQILYNRALIAFEQKQYQKVIEFLDKPDFRSNPRVLRLLNDASRVMDKNNE